MWAAAAEPQVLSQGNRISLEFPANFPPLTIHNYFAMGLCCKSPTSKVRLLLHGRAVSNRRRRERELVRRPPRLQTHLSRASWKRLEAWLGLAETVDESNAQTRVTLRLSPRRLSLRDSCVYTRNQLTGSSVVPTPTHCCCWATNLNVFVATLCITM